LPDFEFLKLQQEYRNYFYIGINLLEFCGALVLLDIHWVMMGFQLAVYCIIQVVHIYFVYNTVFQDYLLEVSFLLVYIYSTDYKMIKTAKSNFIQGKKIK
jgi:hypothetical protein